MISKSLNNSVNEIMRFKITSGMTDKDIESLRSLLDAGSVLLCSPSVQDIYRCCLNSTEAAINLIKKIPNDVVEQNRFEQQLPYWFDAPIRVNVNDPRIWRNETQQNYKLYNKNELVMSTTADCFIRDGMFCVDRVWYFGDGTEIPLPEYKYQRCTYRNDRLFKYGNEYRSVNIVTKKVRKPTRRFLVSKLSVPSELHIKKEQSYFACMGDVRMPTTYPVKEYGLQYDIVQDMYLFANGRPCPFIPNMSLISCNSNWILFQKKSVLCIVDSLHFTERIIDPAPIHCYVDSNGRLIEYDYPQGYCDYDTKEIVKYNDGTYYKIAFHEKYVLIYKNNHIEFWMDYEQIARRYMPYCDDTDYIYFYKGIVYTSQGQYNVNNCAQQQLIVLCTVVNSDIAMYVSQFLLL
jgi:hypothetical protein